MKLQHHILTLILLLMALPTLAQNKKIAQQKEVVKKLERSIAQEEKKLKELNSNIAAKEKTLVNLVKHKEQKEKQVASLGRQIEKQNRLIKAKSQEIKLREEEIKESGLRLDSLEKQTLLFEGDMREIVRAAYRNYRYQDQVTYLLSAESFSEMTRRMAMLRAAAERRKEQIEQLISLRQRVQMERDSLTVHRNELAAKKQELTNDLNKLSKNKQALNKERKELSNYVDLAKQTISKMTSEQKRVVESKLEHQAELNNAKKELKRLQNLAKNNKTGSSFSSKLTDLNLPVEGGKVKRYKGNMAEILGKEGAAVTSIYEGKVLDIKQNKVTNYYEVYIAHGKYITSYANLSAVTVTKNSIVKMGQRIGTIGTAINLSTMATENKIVFGIYSPNPDEVMSAENCFKK